MVLVGMMLAQRCTTAMAAITCGQTTSTIRGRYSIICDNRTKDWSRLLLFFGKDHFKTPIYVFAY
jgi:hypothetical protein